MTQYLVAIHLPDDFDPSAQDKQMERDIDVLNEEMEAKGVRLFAGGLRPATDAKSRASSVDTRDGTIMFAALEGDRSGTQCDGVFPRRAGTTKRR